jgi:hypothetical protein
VSTGWMAGIRGKAAALAEASGFMDLSRSKIESSCWPAVSSWRQAARLYSLISPFSMDFRRIR